MIGARTVEVSADDADIRLDRWFARHFPALGHGRLQKLLRTGQVRVDGARARGNWRLSPGQRIRVPTMVASTPPPPVAAPPIEAREARALRARVLYRDDELIALDKPAGLAVQGGTGQRRHIDRLASALVEDGAPTPKLVHRLDKDTSGVLLLATTAVAAARLARAFKTGAVRKTYWAVVVGAPSPPAGVIESGLVKRAGAGGERMVAESATGRRALTRYRTLDHAGRAAALLALYPETGRTHQLRVHCAELGTPILGDGKYGGRAAFALDLRSARRLHLHARSIELPASDGTILRLAAPLPDHMRASIDHLGLHFDDES